MSSKIHAKNEKKMKRETLGSLPFKGPGYLFVSFNHQRVASVLQWRHTRWLKETPSPSPKDPLHSFQVKLDYLPCLFEDVQYAHCRTVKVRATEPYYIRATFLPLRHSFIHFFSKRHHCIHRLINHVYTKGQDCSYSLPHDMVAARIKH